MLAIRNEREADRKIVEDITRKAFYNLYVPGCVEHYLVHIMRDHEDFIPELDFVAELDGQVIGNIMYTKARLTDEQGAEKDILTFGPVSIAPEHQRKGYGKALMEQSRQLCEQRLQKLPKVQRLYGSREISLRNDGKRTERGRSGRQKVVLP